MAVRVSLPSSIGERLGATEVQERDDPSATADATLEERVTRLEERVRKGVCSIDDVLEDLGDGVKEQTRAKAETLFGEIQICLAVLPVDESHTDDGVEFISGSSESFARSMSTLDCGENRINEVGSRHFLVGRLHQMELQLRKHGCYEQQLHCGRNAQCQLVGPALRFHGKPTETINPLVVTTVSDIAKIARRLGMSWEVFDPVGYSMRAQGNGYGIFSTPGWPNRLVLQYKPISVNDSSFGDSELYVPTREADMMGFAGFLDVTVSTSQFSKWERLTKCTQPWICWTGPAKPAPN